MGLSEPTTAALLFPEDAKILPDQLDHSVTQGQNPSLVSLTSHISYGNGPDAEIVFKYKEYESHTHTGSLRVSQSACVWLKHTVRRIWFMGDSDGTRLCCVTAAAL